jgi:hypothetical protein
MMTGMDGRHDELTTPLLPGFSVKLAEIFSRISIPPASALILPHPPPPIALH